MLDFKFSNALMHFVRTDAPHGFLPKFALSYLVAAIIFGSISLVVMRPIIEFYIEIFVVASSGQVDTTDPTAFNQMMQDRMPGITQASGLIFLVLLPLTLVIWATFEASIQRHYIRKEPFRLALGNDEWRLMTVGLVVYLLLIVVTFVAIIPMALVVGLAAATENAALVLVGVIAGYILFFGVMFMYAVRICAASALTIRDERVRIFESFHVTKGRFWPIAGALLIVWVGFYVLQIFIYGMGIFTLAGQFADIVTGNGDADLAAILAKTRTPGVLGTIASFLAMLSFSYGLSMVILGGPGALAALNDPDKPFQGADPSEVFK